MTTRTATNYQDPRKQHNPRNHHHCHLRQWHSPRQPTTNHPRSPQKAVHPAGVAAQTPLQTPNHRSQTQIKKQGKEAPKEPTTCVRGGATTTTTTPPRRTRKQQKPSKSRSLHRHENNDRRPRVTPASCWSLRSYSRRPCSPTTDTDITADENIADENIPHHYYQNQWSSRNPDRRDVLPSNSAHQGRKLLVPRN